MNTSPIHRHYARAAITALLLCFGKSKVFAHQGSPPISQAQTASPLATVPQFVLPPTDAPAELAVDASNPVHVPLRYAIVRSVQVTPATYGTWEQLPTGRLWRLRFISSGATDLNFGFTKYHLPNGATLHIISESDSYFQGPYTEAQNQPAEQLWTPVVPGEAAVIELFVPNGATEEPQLELTQVSTGYRDLFHRSKDLTNTKAETCEIDVVCPQAAAWTNEIRSVARISIGGAFLCSGTLIMDAPADFRPFFLTANHCSISPANAATVVVYWNYQSPTCGQHGLGGSLAQNQTGSTFRAAKTDVDFSLIELSQFPPTSYQVFYSGWDRSGTAANGCVGIHHPNGDGKCISFSSNPLTTINSCIGTGGSATHWQVRWTSGVTEGGSSGSGIWNTNTHLLLGTLSGGGSDCSTPTSPDCYGKFSVAWASGTSSATRLRDWLDPLNSGVTTVAGSNPTQVPSVQGAGATLVAESCAPTNGVMDPGELVTVNIQLQNSGTAPTTNLIATLLASNGVAQPSAPQSYGAIAAGGSVSRSFSFIANGLCGGTVLPALQLQDGTKNFGTATFSFPLGIPIVTATENFDGVTAPTLPAGWSASPAGVWVTTSVQNNTPPNAVFASNPSSVSDQQLTSLVFPVGIGGAQLRFRHFYNTEPGFDGGVLEISINGGAFTDVIGAGGTFLTGAYNGTIPTDQGNPLAGRDAWTGNSGGFVLTTIALPAATAGANVQFRWRLGSDSSVSATGWYVDTVALSVGFACCTGAPPVTLTAPQIGPGNQFQFSVIGGTGFSYTILAASNLNLPVWIPLITNVAPFSFTDSDTVEFPNRFYRARSQ